ncbi:MAG: flagellar hook-basal body complex protein FliE [Treponema sp.]|nr:flagellar hook-basal body complex protein FliE [Treponema sp.]
MSISFGIHPANFNIPIQPVDSTAEITRSVRPKKIHGTGEKGKFEKLLLEAASKMNSQQIAVSSIQEQVITNPDSVDVHDVTTAMAKAKMSLELAQKVADRLINGWNELAQNK